MPGEPTIFPLTTLMIMMGYKMLCSVWWSTFFRKLSLVFLDTRHQGTALRGNVRSMDGS